MKGDPRKDRWMSGSGENMHSHSVSQEKICTPNPAGGVVVTAVETGNRGRRVENTSFKLFQLVQ